jgi:hypothetical protein
MGEEVAAGEIADQGLVDRCAVEDEVVDLLGERQLGDRDLTYKAIWPALNRPGVRNLYSP